MAIGRNRLLEEATRAYLGFQRDRAKDLSKQGQELNIIMKSCHKEVPLFQ